MRYIYNVCHCKKYQQFDSVRCGNSNHVPNKQTKVKQISNLHIIAILTFASDFYIFVER